MVNSRRVVATTTLMGCRRRRVVAANMTTRAVLTADACEICEREEQYQGKSDHQEHLDPARPTRVQDAVVPDGGQVFVWVRLRVACAVGHPHLLVSPLSCEYTRHCVSVKTCCLFLAYALTVPRLWDETIEAHRREVRQAILDTTGALVVEHGLLSVTMSQIAEQTGIGRATLYKYFPDVEAILMAWHEHQVAGHLAQLVDIRDTTEDARDRLEAVLEAYALLSHKSQRQHETEIGALLHRDHKVVHAQRRVWGLFRDLLRRSADDGDVRDDIAPEELASFCLHALSAAASLPSKAAVRRLVAVTVAGLRPIGPSSARGVATTPRDCRGAERLPCSPVTTFGKIGPVRFEGPPPR